jgi:hypothetical protein
MNENWATLKEHGNTEFKNKRYESSIQYYTKAISKILK